MKPYYQDEAVTLYHARCEDVLPHLDMSFDAVICDPPYGTTACAWDTPIDFAFMWRELKRLTRRNAAIVLFGSQPFTSALVMSNPEWFKYAMVWKKSRPFDIFNSKNKPVRIHEDILVFSDGTVANKSPRRMTYNPQGLIKVDRVWSRPRAYNSAHGYDRPSDKLDRILEFTNYPQTVLEFANPNNNIQHPTQKPLDLLEYLVLTYTNPGDTVLDFAAGSGTTAVAAKKLGRKCVAVEMELEYCEAAAARLYQGVFDLVL